MQVRYLVLLISMIALAWAYWGDRSGSIATWFSSENTTEQMAKAGQWGDSFGAFNAFASAAGFAVLLATLFLQRKTINDQAKDLHRQRFESSFFELLRLLERLRSEVKFKYSAEYMRDRAIKGTIVSSKTRKGRDAFRAMIPEITFWLIKGGINQNPTQEQAVNVYMRRVHSPHESTLAPYLRLIYTILDRIRADKLLDDEEKIRFANLLRGQLTSYEVSLIGYNGLAAVSSDLAKMLIYFRMLKYLPSNATRRRLSGIYPAMAFKGRDGPLAN